MVGVPAAIRTSKYQLLEEIGHGGMATVYRARDTRLERDVAVKLLHRHLRESDEVEARFSGEARAVAKLRHPNIVEVFDVSDEDEEDRYLVVELIRGCTLREILKRRGALPPELAAEIVMELLAALEHAHLQGVVHRDVKPENVLIELSPGGRASVDDFDRPRVKLTDFGIAKLLDAQGITSTGQVLGSPAHMAPEQIEGRSVDGRADIFSLGVLFYECVVGSLPFAGKNPAQVLRNVLEGNFTPPDVARPQVGARWSSIITRALQREPDARYPVIIEFAQAVRAELELAGFNNSRRDISGFLSNMDGYEQSFTDRVVPQLRGAGETARAAGEFSAASAHFNRALAYRPGDPQILAAISGIRQRHHVLQGLRVAALCLGLAVLGFFGVRFVGRSISAQQAKSALTTSAPSAAVPALASAAAVAQQLPSAQSPERDPIERRPKRVSRTTAEVVEAVLPTRQVSVRLTGAVGGTLRIDGKERPWFGVQHTLDVGVHTFEFVPPDDTCCVASRRVVNILVGDAPEVILGNIPFKDASLVVDAEGAAGSSLSCPSLFAGQLELPGRKTVALDQARVSGVCTLSKADQGFTARRRVVTLLAGQTTVLPWP